MNRSVAITFSCLFIVMLGFSVTLAVLPLRLGSDGLDLAESTEGVAFHVGALTGVYAFAQFVAAPFWGRWSDRHSRRLVLTWSLLGFGVSQLMFGVAPELPLLYASRIFGGLFSAAMFPLAAAAVADTFPSHRQQHGMAWLNASASLGVMAGPALSGLTSQWSWQANSPLGQFEVDGFMVPFFVLAVLSVAMTAITLWKLPQYLPGASRNTGQSTDTWVEVAIRIRGILAVVVASQIAMALFMTAFALHADVQLNLGPKVIGAAFALCGLLTASVQVATVWAIAHRWDERKQILWGSFAMAVGLLFMPIALSMIPMIGSISIFVIGAAIVATSLLSLVAKVCSQNVGAATGLVGSATYLGQILGPLVTGMLFAWNWSLPFYAGAAVMLAATALWLVKPVTVDDSQDKENAS